MKAFPSSLRKFKIPTRLSFGYTLLFTSIVIFADLVLYSQTYTLVTNSIDRELQLSNKGIVNQIHSTVQASIRNHLKAIAESNLHIIRYNYKRYQQGEITESEARRISSQQLATQKIGLTGYPYAVDSNGIIQVHPKEKLIHADLTQYPFIQKQMKNKTGYIEYEWKNPGEKVKRKKALYMTYFKPWDWIISASSYRDEFKSLVNIEDFKKSILSITFGETGYCYVFDTKGEIVIHPFITGNFYDQVDSNGTAFVKEMIQRKSGTIYYTWKNPQDNSHREKLVVFQYIPEYDWIISSSTYVEEFNQPLTSITIINFIFLGLTILLILLATTPLSRSIVSPLQRMMNTLKQASKGDLTIRINDDKNAKDELFQLATYFNQFMSKLEQSNSEITKETNERITAQESLLTSNKKLENLNQHLEKRVELRTYDLKRSLEKLTAMQNKLVETEKMAALGNLVTGVAHEINTPLGTAMTGMSFLQESIANLNNLVLNGKATKNCFEEFITETGTSSELISINLSKVSNLIKRFKTLSMSENGHQLSNFNLLETVSNTINSLSVNRENINFEIEIDPNQYINSYEQSFYQIFQELIMNSLHHAFSDNEKGLITITCKIDNEAVNIIYSDNGIGIPPSFTQSIFEPFVTSKRISGNSGLGLHFIYILITQKLQGNIELNTEHKHEGFKVLITLPLSILAPNTKG